MTRREQKLGQARADLAELPNLLDELARCLTERGDTTGGKPGKISGSPPPLRLDVLHLVNDRRKPGWEDDDPEYTLVFDRHGSVRGLERWVKKLALALPEFPDLTEHATVRSETATLIEFWDFIYEQDWAETMAHQISYVTNQVKASLGIRPEYRPRCRYCYDEVIPVEANTHTLTTWDACAYGLCRGCRATYPKGPALDALGQVQEPLPLKDVAEMTGLPLATLYRWYVVGAISPTAGQKRGKLFDLAAVRTVATRIYGRGVQ